MKIQCNCGAKYAFDVTPDHLAFYDIDMVYRVEPGEFRLMVGPSSRDEDLQSVTLRVEERS